MPAPRTTTAPPTQPDPLADLRPQDAPGAPQDPPPAPDAPDDSPQADDVAPFTHAWHAESAAAIVQFWHADLTASSFGHGGGTCGCRYLAAMALRAAVGDPLDAPEEPGEDGGQNGA